MDFWQAICVQLGKITHSEVGKWYTGLFLQCFRTDLPTASIPYNGFLKSASTARPHYPIPHEIYEKAADFGGTWRTSAYISIRSQWISIPTGLQRTDPKRKHEYWCKLTAKYDLYSCTVFNRLVVSAERRSKEQLYNIVSEDIASGERFTTTVKVLISMIGILELPRYPNIAGISSFKGEMFQCGGIPE
ncbi:hypothetical protein B0H10DRAFT_2354757 [Mycena sp. CBHHK59/15]|nr:hypothetical protein B0H10DRAFT_2354757 [Mycena sp. CBHHK59/15]